MGQKRHTESATKPIPERKNREVFIPIGPPIPRKENTYGKWVKVGNKYHLSLYCQFGMNKHSKLVKHHILGCGGNVLESVPMENIQGFWNRRHRQAYNGRRYHVGDVCYACARAQRKIMEENGAWDKEIEHQRKAAETRNKIRAQKKLEKDAWYNQ